MTSPRRDVEDSAEAAAAIDRVRLQLRRQIASAHAQLDAAEPGTADFLTAYTESTRLEAMYRQVRWSTMSAPVSTETAEPAPLHPRSFAQE